MTPRPPAAADDGLDLIAPLLRVQPELQDFCRFGGGWRAAHDAEAEGWAAFHIVARGACMVERDGQAPVRLTKGDILLLPQGDAHVVYGGGGRHEMRDIAVSYRDYIRVKQTGDAAAADTEIVCGRLRLEAALGALLLKTLPPALVFQADAMPIVAECRGLIALIRRELEQNRTGAGVIATDIASALLVLLLRDHLERAPAVPGLLALLSQRETARATAAMLADPSHRWSLDELAETSAVSRATLTRAFRRVCGLSPEAMLTEFRLDRARNRIVHGNDGFAQIAADVGYQSEAALSRALHRRFGIRPGAMRQAARQGAGQIVNAPATG